MKIQAKSNTHWFQGYTKAKWEIKYTNKNVSGPGETIINSEINNSDEEFQKNNMGFCNEKICDYVGEEKY